MALDGIVIANLVHELNETIQNTRINKIAQPEADELLLTLKGGEKGQYRLAISASASLPFMYLTEENKQSPATAPTFCMVLRKHIANGRIVRIYQPDMERIIHMEIEHLNEMGDLCKKILIIELMGKHSNIIFCREDGMIIDSIKHISSAVSSLREVLPGKQYEIAKTQQDKRNPMTVTKDDIMLAIKNRPTSVATAIYSSFTGISPLMANEIAYRSGLDADAPIASLYEADLHLLVEKLFEIFEAMKNNAFTPVIVRKQKEPIDFASFPLSMYGDYDIMEYDSISHVLELFYAEKNIYNRIRQKSVDLRKIVSTALERNVKKYDLQKKQLLDAKKREKYKLYGELINTFGYGLEENAKVLVAENYYDNNKKVEIPLDPALSPQENAKKYFDRYSKLKRTALALEELSKETKAQIEHLESIQNSLDIALSSDDLIQIKEELVEYGFIKKGRGGKKIKTKSKPFHYLSSDGYDIYVGKNNYQNDELTFKFATGNDWWFHAKGMPGSHVVVKVKDEEVPDRVFEEAGQLAAYYSKGKNSDKVEIDYIQKKHVKKPAGSAPGFVVYYTNFSLTIHPDISALTLLE